VGAGKAATPILEVTAGRLAMLGNAGHPRVPNPALAARQFLALISTEIPGRHQARPTFLRAH
jgi:hypothetical protein